MAFQMPNYSKPAQANDLTALDQNAIRYLLNPSPSTSEVDTRAAEMAVGSGARGGTRDAARQWKLRDSELINRFQIGNQMLQPYQEREQRATLQTQGEQAQLNNIAAQGREAMRQLQLQEQGLAARQSSSERAALERAVLEGNQAMERLQLSESGTNTRQQAELDARMEQLYFGEEGQNARLDRTIAADRERQTVSEAGQTSRQEAALRAQLEEARLRGDIEGQLQAARLLQQAQLQTQSERAQLGQIDAQGRNRLLEGRQSGMFDLARTELSRPDPRSNPNWRPNYRTERDPSTGVQRVIEVPEAPRSASRNLYGLVDSVDSILRHYGVN